MQQEENVSFIPKQWNCASNSKQHDMHAYVFANKAGTQKKHKSKLCAHYVQNR